MAVTATSQLLAEIADTRRRQAHIAVSYAEAISAPDEVDWPRVNAAIIERWSVSGLQRVKEIAWAIWEMKS